MSFCNIEEAYSTNNYIKNIYNHKQYEHFNDENVIDTDMINTDTAENDNIDYFNIIKQLIESPELVKKIEDKLDVKIIKKTNYNTE